MRVRVMEYKIVLEPAREDRGYAVHCPALPGCYSQGDTREEAIDNIREAIEAYLESLKKAEVGAGRITHASIETTASRNAILSLTSA